MSPDSLHFPACEPGNAKGIQEMTGTAPRHAVLIASGGMDSTVTAYELAQQGSALTLLSFDYGQRHVKEVEFAALIAERLSATHEIVDLANFGRLLHGSALTDTSVPVPDGHYTAQSMRATVVPNRNAVMLNIAASVAVAREADAVAFGAHAGDHEIYPDCRPAFFEKVAACIRAGNEGFIDPGFQVLAPFLHLTKADIARRGDELAVPFGLTWSCYKGGDVHCGTCGTCVERREAFSLAGLADPTVYAEVLGAEVAR